MARAPSDLHDWSSFMKPQPYAAKDAASADRATHVGRFCEGALIFLPATNPASDLRATEAFKTVARQMQASRESSARVNC